MLPLLAAVLLLAAGSGRCCSNASAAIVQPSAHADKAATTADAPSAETSPVKASKALPADKAEAAPQLDMNTLIERLKKTTAIGVLTKLVLRSNVNDLIAEVKRYKQAQGTPTQLSRIRAHFNGLLLKVLALLADDPKLAEDIQCARASLWQHLMEVKA